MITWLAKALELSWDEVSPIYNLEELSARLHDRAADDHIMMSIGVMTTIQEPDCLEDDGLIGSYESDTKIPLGIEIWISVNHGGCGSHYRISPRAPSFGVLQNSEL